MARAETTFHLLYVKVHFIIIIIPCRTAGNVCISNLLQFKSCYYDKIMTIGMMMNGLGSLVVILVVAA